MGMILVPYDFMREHEKQNRMPIFLPEFGSYLEVLVINFHKQFLTYYEH